MNDRELDDARENDRRLRATIDPLIGELSPQGKFELAMRLALEGARGFVSERAPLPLVRRAELAAASASSVSERDGAPGEEAHAETVSAD